jgi:hypothetical protein
MAHKRTRMTATLLQNGSVLLAGGLGDASASAELYVPGTGFVATGSMTSERSGAAAASLFDGAKVLIVGGTNSSGLASAELYDPSTGKFTATGPMAVARSEHTAALLQSGRVLIVGLGLTDIGARTALAELYDPATGKFTSAGSLPSELYDLSATLLQDGRVLVVGGDTDLEDETSSAKAYLWSEDTKAFTPTGPLATARGWPVATLLSDGRVLVAGGGNDSGATLTAELYRP